MIHSATLYQLFDGLIALFDAIFPHLLGTLAYLPLRHSIILDKLVDHLDSIEALVLIILLVEERTDGGDVSLFVLLRIVVVDV